MDKTDFISRLAEKTGISVDQASSVNGIFDNFNILKIGNADSIIPEIAKKIGVDEATAKQVYDTAYGMIGDGILSKIKNPFG